MGCKTSRENDQSDYRPEVQRYKMLNIDRKRGKNDNINDCCSIVILPSFSSLIKRLNNISFDIYTSINVIDLMEIINVILDIDDDKEFIDITFNTTNESIDKSLTDKLFDKYPNCIDVDDKVIYIIYKIIPKKLHIHNLYDTEECIICLSNSPKYYFIPCRHLCLCTSCLKYFNKNKTCYLCYTPIKSIGKICKKIE